MHIDWASLITVGVVAAAAALIVVLLVSLAVVDVSARARQRSVRGKSGVAGRAPITASDVGGAAVLCVVAAGTVVGYGVYLMVA